MQVRGVVLVTLALFLGIAALVLHLLALCSPHWKITKRDLQPAMTPVSYGLWERCEYVNMTLTKQGVALGVRANILICRANRYMRYSAENFTSCYPIRRTCPTTDTEHLPKGCSCRYLPSAKGLQWLTVLAAVCLVLGLLLLYLKTITSAQNDSAKFILGYGPFICFILTLLLMVTALILLGAYFRRDTYEDYSFPLKAISDDYHAQQGFDLHSLRSYAKNNEAKFSHDRYIDADTELRLDANTHYHTVVGRATIYEIVATVLIFIVTALTLWLGIAPRTDEI